jgi:GntR family transcriptional repressor for pyruvate dehydrogenase complex
MPQNKNHKETLNLDEKVYLQLVNLIDSGQFSENTRLPSENKLAEQFEVSRPVLRQALSRLRTEGKIISRQGAGSFVLRRPNANILEFGQLSNLTDVRKCLEFRRGLEGEAASHAAINRTEHHNKVLADSIEAMNRSIAEESSGIENDYAFHLAVGQATENRFFVVSLEALRTQIIFGINLIRSLSKSTPQQRMEKVVREHSRILETIRSGDSKEARKAMTDHIGSGIERLFQ